MSDSSIAGFFLLGAITFLLLVVWFAGRTTTSNNYLLPREEDL